MGLRRLVKNRLATFVRDVAGDLPQIQELERRIGELAGKIDHLAENGVLRANGFSAGFRARLGDLGGGREGRGLFVVGHGRSGTTILASALNYASHEIRLLDEAFLFGNDLFTDETYVGRYNEKMRGYIESALIRDIDDKHDICSPKFIAPAGTHGNALGIEMLETLFAEYRFAGEKITFLPFIPGGFAAYFRRFLDFHSSFFPKSRYILLFRNLDEVLASCLNTFPQLNTDENHLKLLYSLSLAYYTLLNLYMALPNVNAIWHNKINRQTFAILGGVCNLDLGDAACLYNHDAPTDRRRAQAEVFHRYPDYGELKSLTETIHDNIDMELCAFGDRRRIISRDMKLAFKIAKNIAARVPDANR